MENVRESVVKAEEILERVEGAEVTRYTPLKALKRGVNVSGRASYLGFFRFRNTDWLKSPQVCIDASVAGTMPEYRIRLEP